jgi:hypothetical protein
MAQPVWSSSNPAAFGDGKVSSVLALVELFNKGKHQYEVFKSKRSYTVNVSEEDPLYSDIHAWLMSIMPNERHHSLLVSSPERSYDDMETAEDSGSTSVVEKRPPLKVRFDDQAHRDVVINGHKVRVWVASPEQSKEAAHSWEREPKKIKLQAASYEGQQAIIAELNRLNDEKAIVRKAVLKMVAPWGGQWRTRSDLPPRTMDSVFIPDEQKNRILSDVGAFLAQEDRYNKMSFPWHRGYMLYGPPGTGKTSIVKGVANHYNLDLWYIGLADLNNESGLLSLLSQVGPRSILLLEDIDTVKIAKGADAEGSSKITVGSLLNALDGVSTPHGLITMMTTNHFDQLDERLVRAGRMDLVEEIGYPTPQTLEKMFTHFYGQSPSRWWGSFHNDQLDGVSVAQIAEIFKSNMDDPEAAAKQAFEVMVRADPL